MKRMIIALLLLVAGLSAQAVMKEKDLARTLGVLKLELKRNYTEQKEFMARYEVMSKSQHEQLVDYMKRSEQIGLILYSQRTDFTFDMAYACQQATDLYKELHKTNMPYEQIKERLMAEVARYDSLIIALSSLPPALHDSLTTDRLERLADEVGDSVTVEEKEEPYELTAGEQKDRQECLTYAKALRNNLMRFINTLSKDNKYYQEVSNQVERLNNYARQRYADLQNSIYKNAGTNYIKMLTRLPLYLMMIKRDFNDKYLPLSNKENYSEWRGPIVLGVSVFMLFYILIATLLSYGVMKWLPWLIRKIAPKYAQKIETRVARRIISEEEYKEKKPLITLALGVALFALAIMIVQQFMYRNLFIMAADLMINIAWLMEAILVSLLIRLKGEQVKDGLRLYLPFITMAFIVIIFRIVLIPNSLVNLIYPPLLLIFVFWQISRQGKYRARLPLSDSLYATISLAAMIVGCICSWVGYTLLAVQIMIWWTYQLAAIQTITCLYDLTSMYEERVLTQKLLCISENRVAVQEEDLPKRIRKGYFFTHTWLFDLVRMTLIPVVAVISVLVCIYMAAKIFEMTTIVEKIFFYNFIDQAGVIQLSLFKVCLVLALFFVFRYLNYAIRSYYHHWYLKAKKDADNFNETLARNVIAIIVWGLYFWLSLVILQVPKSGISIVTAGLATGMGFAMKDLLENFFYGISLMTGRVRVGDYIECDGVLGKVESITYQSTQIATLDGSVIAFLNSSLFTKNFKNLTRSSAYAMAKMPVGVAYGTDIERVRRMLIEAMEGMRKKTDDGRDLIDPNKPVGVSLSEFGDSSVNLTVYAWVLVDQRIPFMSKTRELIYNTLQQNRVEIPFPQRDVHIRNVASAEVVDK
ncbi:MAG: mechanosensitive ion channel family protein [Bacteroidaceae bacterium]|nr:mechanosensitive ion channel family protein [Bacteroidaceae bacterium]